MILIIITLMTDININNNNDININNNNDRSNTASGVQCMLNYVQGKKWK